MKTTCVLLWTVAGCCLTGLSQTNAPASESDSLEFHSVGTIFPVRLREPSLRLRLPDEAEAGKNLLSLTPTNSASVESVPSGKGEAVWGAGHLSSFEQGIYRMLEEGGYLTPKKKPDSPIERGIEAVFEPEIFQAGKVKLSCSVATAIKRKNPLCLLSPLVFQMSW